MSNIRKSSIAQHAYMLTQVVTLINNGATEQELEAKFGYSWNYIQRLLKGYHYNIGCRTVSITVRRRNETRYDNLMRKLRKNRAMKKASENANPLQDDAVNELDSCNDTEDDIMLANEVTSAYDIAQVPQLPCYTLLSANYLLKNANRKDIFGKHNEDNRIFIPNLELKILENAARLNIADNAKEVYQQTCAAIRAREIEIVENTLDQPCIPNNIRRTNSYKEELYSFIDVALELLYQFEFDIQLKLMNESPSMKEFLTSIQSVLSAEWQVEVVDSLLVPLSTF